MKTFNLIKTKDCSSLLKETPVAGDYSVLINEDTLFIKGGDCWPLHKYIKAF
jgi:hypothetical protein